jgi:hypothetical protein
MGPSPTIILVLFFSFCPFNPFLPSRPNNDKIFWAITTQEVRPQLYSSSVEAIRSSFYSTASCTSSILLDVPTIIFLMTTSILCVRQLLLAGCFMFLLAFTMFSFRDEPLRIV